MVAFSEGLVRNWRHSIVLLLVACVWVVLTGSCEKITEDEAKKSGLTPADFPQIQADVFKPLDGGIELSVNEIMGRNTWNLWSAGNQRFWDYIARDTGG